MAICLTAGRSGWLGLDGDRCIKRDTQTGTIWDDDFPTHSASPDIGFSVPPSLSTASIGIKVLPDYHIKEKGKLNYKVK